MKRKNVSRVLAYVLTAAMVASSFTAAPKASAASGKYVKSLKVKKKVTVSAGSKVTVKPVVKVAKKATKALTVKVKDKKLVKAAYSAKKQVITITGKKTGKTTVTVTTKGVNKKRKKLSAKITVNVTAGKVENVTASPAVSATAPATPVPTAAPASTSSVVVTVPSPTPEATHYAAVNVKGNVVDVYAQNGIYSADDLNDYSSAKSRAKAVSAVREVKRLKGVVADSQRSSDSEEQEESDSEDAKSGNLQDAKVYLIPNTDNQLDIDNLPKDAIETATDANGNYEFEQVSCGDYCLLIEKDNYKPAIQFVTLGSLQPDYQMEAMYVLDETIAAAVRGRISGTIVDATNKEPIEGLTVELRHNKGNTFGDAYMTTTTDADGIYTFGSDEELLEADQYTVYVKDERKLESDDDRHYISNIMNTCVFNNTPTSLDIAMTKPVSASGGGLRFVLQWGSEGQDGVPSDLDSHFYGPRAVSAAEGEEDMFHVYFVTRDYGVENTVYANLDVDDISYEGPETVTLAQESDGIYYYYVKNFSGTESLARSQATVKVYVGDSVEPLTVYNVPSSNDNELWWKVCSYNSRTHELTSYNVLEEENSLDSLNPNGYYRGYETGLKSITAANEDDFSYYGFYSDDPQGISVHGYVPWSTMKEELQFELKPGYTASFEEAKDELQPRYRGDLVLTNDNGSCRYRLYYYYDFDDDYRIQVEGESLTRYSYYSDVIDLYLATDSEEDLGEIIRNLKFTSSSDKIVCGDVKYNDEEGEGSLSLLEAESGEVITYMSLYVYTGRYLSSVTYEGEEIDFYEDRTSVDVYADDDDDVDLEEYSYHCADGFTANVVYDEDDDSYLQIRNSAGEVVAEKPLYLV